MAAESERGLGASPRRSASRTAAGRSLRTIELSNWPAWHAPLRNSSPSREPHGLRVRSGKTIGKRRAPLARFNAARRALKCSGYEYALANPRQTKPVCEQLRARSTNRAETGPPANDKLPRNG